MARAKEQMWLYSMHSLAGPPSCIKFSIIWTVFSTHDYQDFIPMSSLEASYAFLQILSFPLNPKFHRKLESIARQFFSDYK